MKRLEIDHDSFVQDALIVESFSNTIEVPSGVLQAVNDMGKVVKLPSLQSESMCIGYSYNEQLEQFARRRHDRKLKK